MASLRELDGSGNRLEGVLPPEWAALHSLGSLTLADNRLQVGRSGRGWCLVPEVRCVWAGLLG